MVKETFTLQWHLSENCNLKCLHCYQENHKPICLNYKKLEKIYNDYKELLKVLDKRGHINITGGEPLCNPYLFKILDLIKKDSNLISFSILTNGTLINEEIAKKIKSYNPSYVQVSLEGGKRTNDYIRGKGTYKKIGNAIKLLNKEGIYTSISFTANHLNYKEFKKVVKYGEKLKVNSIWSDRFIPLGSSKDKELTLSLDETKEYLKILGEERRKLKFKNSKTNVSMVRALQFKETNDIPYSCSCASSLLTVMENGDLVPCRRMPIVVGNLFKDSMINLYKNSEILKDLRKEYIPEDCKNCEHSNSCKGGLKCLTYALTNNYKLKDVGCDL